MIGPPRAPPEALHRQRLFTDRLVCMGRRNHPAMVDGLDLHRYVAADHLVVSPRGLPGSVVDDELGRRGEERRVVLEVPHFLVAPRVVARSDLLVTLPERLAQEVAALFDLVVTPLPFETPAIEFLQLWHARHHDDPAHVWLRARVAEAVAG